MMGVLMAMLKVNVKEVTEGMENGIFSRKEYKDEQSDTNTSDEPFMNSVDYLSTVSGGGYTGSAFLTFVSRERRMSKKFFYERFWL
jgi:hypothetical protein